MPIYNSLKLILVKNDIYEADNNVFIQVLNSLKNEFYSVKRLKFKYSGETGIYREFIHSIFSTTLTLC
jgi:hypothetical protein